MQDSKYLLRDESFQRLFTLLFWITLHQFSEHKSTLVCDLGKGAFFTGMACKGRNQSWQACKILVADGGLEHIGSFVLKIFWRQALALRSLPLYTDMALSGTTACELLAHCAIPEEQVWSRGRCNGAQLNFQPERNNRYQEATIAPSHFRGVLVLKSEYNTVFHCKWG